MTSTSFKLSHTANSIKLVALLTNATILVVFNGKLGERQNTGLDGEGSNDDPAAKKEKSYMSHLTKFIQEYTQHCAGKNMEERIASMAAGIQEILKEKDPASWRSLSNMTRRHFDDESVFSNEEFQGNWFYEGCSTARARYAETAGKPAPQKRGAKMEETKTTKAKGKTPSPKKQTAKPAAKAKTKAPKAGAKGGKKKAASKVEAPANLVNETSNANQETVNA